MFILPEEAPCIGSIIGHFSIELNPETSHTCNLYVCQYNGSHHKHSAHGNTTVTIFPFHTGGSPGRQHFVADQAETGAPLQLQAIFFTQYGDVIKVAIHNYRRIYRERVSAHAYSASGGTSDRRNTRQCFRL